MIEEVKEEESLYRSVKPLPQYWKGNVVTSALFKDSKGVSVDRGGRRADESIVKNFKSAFGADQVKAIVCLTAKKCFDTEVLVVAKPLDNNQYHAEIHRSAQEIELTKGQARALAKACNLVYVKP